jgi:hypothetical protein
MPIHDMPKRSQLHVDPRGQIAEQHAPEAFRRFKDLGEKDIQHAAFLLWACQPPKLRSIRAVAKIVEHCEASLRQWKSRWSWDERVDVNGEESVHWSAYVLRHCYPRLVIPAIHALPYTDKLKEAQKATDHRQPMVTSAEPDPEPIPPQALTDFDADAELKRMNGMLQALFGTLVKGMKSNKVTVKASDFPGLVRTWLLINGSPTDIVRAEQVIGENQQPIESVRVRHVKEQNGTDADLLRAMKADLSEAQIIIDTMLTADEQANNVIQFPSENSDNGTK